MSTPEEQTPVIEVTIAAPPAVVWEALRERDHLRHWHGWQFDGLDDEIELIYFGEASETDPGRSITLSGGDRVDLEGEAGSTRVRLTRAPVSDDPEWAAYYDDITEGWTTFLHQLKFSLERHPGQPRRTLFLAGVGPEPDPVDLVEGEPWFRSEHQRGMLVPAWGDGLLVVAHQPEKQTAMAVLTTYDLDEAALAELGSTWLAWWQERYRDVQHEVP
jgi:hypothetical protein